jgi:hypothetical protein
LESAVKQLPEAFVGLDLKASDFLHLAWGLLPQLVVSLLSDVLTWTIDHILGVPFIDVKIFNWLPPLPPDGLLLILDIPF